MKRWITEKQLERYKQYLQDEEKSQATVEKYIRDVSKFGRYLSGSRISRGQVLSFKKYLIENYKAASVNSMLAALNSFLNWQGLTELKVKPLKIQRSIFRPQEKELTKKEYMRLLQAAEKKNQRLALIIQTICATGIRISELPFITVQAARSGSVEVNCKNKTRVIFLPPGLRTHLLAYTKSNKQEEGSIFLTAGGRPVHRSQIWAEMKSLCSDAGIPAGKVFPHNLRHLFARTYYQLNKDIVALADILGHGSIETTRIYTMTTRQEHIKKISALGLLINAKAT